MFAVLGRGGLHQDRAGITYVQTGALAGPGAAVPAALLHGRRIQISGSEAGPVTSPWPGWRHSGS